MPINQKCKSADIAALTLRDPAQQPIWMWIAAATLVGHGLAAILLHPLGVTWIASLVVAVLLAWLLLRASRIAWVVTLFSSTSQLITSFATDGSFWIVVLAAARIGCLLAPSSRAFIWADRREKVLKPLREPHVASPRRHLITLLANFSTYLNAHLVALGVSGRKIVKEKAYDNKALGRLVIGVVAIGLALTLVYEAQQGFARGSVIVDIVGVAVWTAFNLALFGLIALVSIRLYYSLAKRGQASRSNAAK